MQASSFAHQPKNVDKIKTSLDNQNQEITPKKQAFMFNLDVIGSQSTLQKNFSHRVKIQESNLSIKQEIRRKAKRPWTREEDRLLRKLVENKGAKQWAFISSFFQDRCGKQCRERWHNHLRIGIKKGDWMHEEEWILFLGVHAFGKRWSIISKMLEGRTQNTLKNHWNCKMKPKKEYLDRKLNSLLKNYPVFNRQPSSVEVKLLNLIVQNRKKDLETDQDSQVQMRINMYKKAIQQFYRTKTEIYRQYEMQTAQEKGNQQIIKLDWNLVQSFGKCKKEEQKSISNKSESKDIISEPSEDSYLCKPFQLFWNNGKQNKFNDQIKSVSNMGEQIFDDKSEDHIIESQENQSNLQEKNFADCKQLYGDFCSPIKFNVFGTIDLGDSNKKKDQYKQ